MAPAGLVARAYRACPYILAAHPQQPPAFPSRAASPRITGLDTFRRLTGHPAEEPVVDVHLPATLTAHVTASEIRRVMTDGSETGDSTESDKVRARPRSRAGARWTRALVASADPRDISDAVRAAGRQASTESAPPAKADAEAKPGCWARMNPWRRRKVADDSLLGTELSASESEILVAAVRVDRAAGPARRPS